jgi:hypothetical protein
MGHFYSIIHKKAVRTCAHFLIVLSPAAVDSPEVRGELRTALNENKPILPVRFQACELPSRLSMVQYSSPVTLTRHNGNRRQMWYDPSTDSCYVERSLS